ncbi:hypothetical protein [Nakamurella multipartita]|nr:hypothetical protein [Nakamurella multipartita]
MIVRERRPTLVPPPGDPQDELMGWYRERVLPGIHNRVLDTEAIGRIRDRVCAPLHGRVVEIGFGSGLNVPHYPPAVTRVHAIEPSARARDPDVRRWQQRLNPLNRRLSGCRLDTGVPAVLRDGGLHVGAGREYYLPGAARWAAYLYEGTARTPQ